MEFKTSELPIKYIIRRVITIFSRIVQLKLNYEVGF